MQTLGPAPGVSACQIFSRPLCCHLFSFPIFLRGGASLCKPLPLPAKGPLWIEALVCKLALIRSSSEMVGLFSSSLSLHFPVVLDIASPPPPITSH